MIANCPLPAMVDEWVKIHGPYDMDQDLAAQKNKATPRAAHGFASCPPTVANAHRTQDPNKDFVESLKNIESGQKSIKRDIAEVQDNLSRLDR